MHIVGASSLDLCAVVCQPGHQGAFVKRAAESLTVGIQNADIPAVSAQGMQHVHPSRRHRPETARREVTAGGDQTVKLQTLSMPLYRTYFPCSSRAGTRASVGK